MVSKLRDPFTGSVNCSKYLILSLSFSLSFSLSLFLSLSLQLHEGFRKLNLKPAINFSPEDYDEFTNFGSENLSVENLERKTTDGAC